MAMVSIHLTRHNIRRLRKGLINDIIHKLCNNGYVITRMEVLRNNIIQHYL